MMLRPHAPRRRARYAPQFCAFAAAFLLLLSLSVLHSRLSSSPIRLSLPFRSSPSSHTVPDSLFDDADNDAFDASSDDLIDELDDGVDEAGKGDKLSEEDELRSDDDLDSDDSDLTRTGGLFWDHLLAVARRSFGKSSNPFVDEPLFPDRREITFGSDDQPVDDDVRIKLDSISSIEDLMLVKPGSGRDSALRSGWVRWLEGKADFLRRDKMLRSNLELLNPKNHPLLQDPDGPGLASLTKGDRLMQRAIWNEIEMKPFGGAGMKRVDRRKTLNLDAREQERRRRWGYFPGLDPHLSFSEFIERFLGSGKCGLRVFMVWNSPAWMYGVRHQRGLESLLHHHSDACVVIFSETMELDFFSSFVKEGFKIAVAMPNLDELFNNTPVQVFATVWHEWRKTKYYPIHYSELVRLAALYKYGGVYLDSDVLVLRPLTSLQNSLGIENQIGGVPVYSGAVMSFKKSSAFLLECLGEFYSTYEDTRFRWNGAELMTRVINRLTHEEGKSYEQIGVNIEPSLSFFPIGSHNITSYFAEAADEEERTKQDALFAKILNESITFHFWNGVTSALVPEPNSFVERLLNHLCLHCSDVL
ncbi:uncharacterized protein At4g19900 isoform X1 [Dioscorea cayenensis subsp. rotundata]|uniref:Uncharacterized protein At4g19900 isoform X1 n=1 Tax=Dioscorea cayennensis subsp. rotundata TaxID=55577 RepID=A0AB40CIS8_DIOCR|nr:uncharacterized protein At4g19900 isoform X1 [Dioscorea cayenensis subsp. rotundata]